MRTKGNCTTKWQSGAKLFSLALAGVRKRRRSMQMPVTQPVPHAGHLYTTHDTDTSAAAGWLEARGGPDPARGMSDPSAWRGRCGGARGIEGGGGWRWNAEVGLWTQSGGATTAATRAGWAWPCSAVVSRLRVSLLMIPDHLLPGVGYMLLSQFAW